MLSICIQVASLTAAYEGYSDRLPPAQAPCWRGLGRMPSRLLRDARSAVPRTSSVVYRGDPYGVRGPPRLTSSFRACSEHARNERGHTGPCYLEDRLGRRRHDDSRRNRAACGLGLGVPTICTFTSGSTDQGLLIQSFEPNDKYFVETMTTSYLSFGNISARRRRFN